VGKGINEHMMALLASKKRCTPSRTKCEMDDAYAIANIRHGISLNDCLRFQDRRSQFQAEVTVHNAAHNN